MAHEVLEQATKADINSLLVEEKIEYKLKDGWVLVGITDLYEKEIVKDFKLTSVWAYKNGDKKVWVRQIEMYKLLYQSIGFPVKGGEICFMFRDWRRGESLRYGKDYPRQAETFAVKLDGTRDTLDYVMERFNLHRAAEEQGFIPDCTDKETWKKDDAWAVKKVGNKNAMRGGVCDSEEKAVKFAAAQTEKKVKTVIEYRPGEYSRCAGYCDVADFCPQWAANKPKEEQE
jgi:hypothetical protein